MMTPKTVMSDRFFGILVLAALAMLTLPVLSVRVPPLVDYANHFARIWLLAGGAAVPPVSAFYLIDWTGTFTNIGLDLVAAALGPILPAEFLAPMFLIAAVVLPPLGAAALNRSLFDGWHWWQVGFAALAWSTTLLAGFLNFQIGVGLALLLAAADPALAWLRATPAFGVRIACAALLLLVHVFALLFYVGLLAGLACGPRWEAFGSRQGFVRSARGVALAALAAALPVAALLLLAPAIPGAHVGAAVGHEWSPFSIWEKLGLLLSSMRNYRRGVDFALLALVAAPALWAAASGRLRYHAGLLLAVVGFVALLFAAPTRLAGTAFIEERFPVMALLTLAAALRPEPAMSRRATAMLGGALLALSATRTALVGVVWHERQADIVSVERALAHLPAGARLLPLEHTPDQICGAPQGRYLFSRGDAWRGSRSIAHHWHYATLAVPWRQAFVPTLFAMRGKQPVRVLPPLNALMVDDAVGLSVGALNADDPTRYAPWWGPSNLAHHLAGWREWFDYALVVNADMPDGAGPARPVAGLELVADEGFAQLHRIQRPGNAAPIGTGDRRLALPGR